MSDSQCSFKMLGAPWTLRDQSDQVVKLQSGVDSNSRHELGEVSCRLNSVCDLSLR